MATKKQKTGAAVAAVVGIGALGLGAVALMRSNNSTNNTNKETDSMFSGMLGGGATGGYSDSTGVPSNGGIGGILSDILQTTPQAQPTPIIINPAGDSGYEDIIPLINPNDNPSDERSDVKQGIDWNIAEPTGPNSKTGLSYGARALLAEINKTSSPVEYNPNNPYTFAPTSKQADYSAYNAGKTGGNAANTPKADNSNTGKTSDNRSQSAGAQALTGSLSNGTAKNGKQTMQVTSPVSTALNAAGQAFSAVGSFFGGLFGGK